MRFGKIGEWKLVDFGSAHRAAGADHVAHSKRYCPPEVATAMVRGNGRAAMCVAPSLDVWASALVLYELFHGAPLLPADVDYTAIVGGVQLPAASLTDAQLRLLQGALARRRRAAVGELLAKHLFRPAQDTVERQRVEVAAFFSDPRGDLKLMREIQSLLSAFVDCRNRTGYEVCPAARLSDASGCSTPRCCRASSRSRATQVRLPPVRGRRGRGRRAVGAGRRRLHTAALPRPRAPPRRPLPQRVQDRADRPRDPPRAPHLAVVCWRGLALNAAANTFSKAFYTALATETNCRVSRAFDAGRAALLRKGYGRRTRRTSSTGRRTRTRTAPSAPPTGGRAPAATRPPTARCSSSPAGSARRAA